MIGPLDRNLSADFDRGRAEMAATMAKVIPISDTLKRWDAERDMLRSDPVRAILLRIEAIADDRAENHMCAVSKLDAILHLARQAAEKHTGRKFENPIFPAVPA